MNRDFRWPPLRRERFLPANRICLTPPFIGRVFEKTVFFSGDFGQDDDYDSESTHFIGCRVCNVDCVGQELTTAVLEDVLVIAWRREGKNLDADRGDLVLEFNDDLVLQGPSVALGDVKAYLEKEE